MNQIETQEEKLYFKKIARFTSKRLNKFINKHLPMFDDKFIDLIVEAYNEGFADGITFEDE